MIVTEPEVNSGLSNFTADAFDHDTHLSMYRERPKRGSINLFCKRPTRKYLRLPSSMRMSHILCVLLLQPFKILKKKSPKDMNVLNAADFTLNNV